MTIRPGTPWGDVIPCPGGLITVADDAALARWLATGTRDPVRVRGGDLVRTVGGVSSGGDCRRYPIDVLHVVLDGADGATQLAVAHVVVRPPGRLGWWRGPLWAAMNVSRLGSWDVAPRAHPNDGRVDVVSVDAAMGARARLQAARRLPRGTHVPHPSIRVRASTTASTSDPRPRAVFVDGQEVGRARTVEVTVLPDAAVIHV